jgi:hypothetical protein
LYRGKGGDYPFDNIQRMKNETKLKIETPHPSIMVFDASMPA